MIASVNKSNFCLFTHKEKAGGEGQMEKQSFI